MHGIIFFYIQKFADEATSGKTTWLKLRETVTATNSRYLPNEVYPDTDAIQLLQKIADTCGEPLPELIERIDFYHTDLIDKDYQPSDTETDTETEKTVY